MSARILLVDDDPNIQDTAKDILEDAGYLVAVAGTLAGGVAALAANPSFHLLISDLNLPDGTGLDLALRARELFPAIRIVLMTGQAEGTEPAGLIARQEGVVDQYLVKPVNPPQLLQVLKHLLE